MDKTESTVRMMLAAIEAPLYDVGVLSERGMLPRLDSISAAAVLGRLSLLKYLEAAGAGLDNSTWIEPICREPRKGVLAKIVESGETMLPGWANVDVRAVGIAKPG
jgi:hypothetical protein